MKEARKHGPSQEKNKPTETYHKMAVMQNQQIRSLRYNLQNVLNNVKENVSITRKEKDVKKDPNGTSRNEKYNE